MEITHIIAEKNFAPVVVLDEQLSSDSPHGEIDIVALMERNLFIEDKFNCKIINIIA